MKKIMLKVLSVFLLFALISCASGSKSTATEEPLSVTTQTNKKDTDPAAEAPVIEKDGPVAAEPTYIDSGIEKIEEPGMVVKEETEGLSDSLTTQENEKDVQMHQVEADEAAKKAAADAAAKKAAEDAAAKKAADDAAKKAAADAAAQKAANDAAAKKAAADAAAKKAAADASAKKAADDAAAKKAAEDAAAKKAAADAAAKKAAEDAAAKKAADDAAKKAAADAAAKAAASKDTGTQVQVAKTDGASKEAVNTQPRSHVVLDNAQFYTVRNGDVLIRIAEHYYGSAKGNYFPFIVAGTEEKIEDADLIEIGQRLTIPEITAALSTEESKKFVKETFFEIADMYDKKGKPGLASQLRSIAAGL